MLGRTRKCYESEKGNEMEGEVKFEVRAGDGIKWADLCTIHLTSQKLHIRYI